jgi:hypothetical protein
MVADLLIFSNSNCLVGLKSIALSIVAKNIDNLNASTHRQLYEAMIKIDSNGKSLLLEICEHFAQCNRCHII